MGKGRAPAPDPRIGEAAMLSAQTGQDHLAFMQAQAEITNAWAAEDRDRYTQVFQPMQDEYIADAQDWASPERMGARVATAQSTVQNQVDAAGAASERQMAAMGVSPNSGKFAASEDTAALQGGLAVAGAGNLERRSVISEEQAMKANAINLGSGLAVNPATSQGLSNGAANSGFQGAMAGYGQQGQLLQAQHQQQMAQWQANAGANAGLWGGIGSIVGLAFGSDEDIKENKAEPAKSQLEAVENMPVEEWDYKEGEGDGGRHIGTYAQDFQRETGMGDGRTINVIDAIGTTMGAIKELSAKVDALAGGRSVGEDTMPTGPAIQHQQRGGGGGGFARSIM